MAQKMAQQDIVEDLKRRLIEKEYSPGERFPTERRLASMYNVSPLTIRCALAELTGQGWLRRRQGSGTYVCEPTVVDIAGQDIAVIFEDRYQHYPLLLNTITQIMKVATSSGVKPIVYTYPEGGLHLDNGELHKALSDGRIAGVLSLGFLCDEELSYLRQMPCRIVLFDNYYSEPDVRIVLLDKYIAASLAVGHLNELGHVNIGIITGCPGESVLLESFQRAMSMRRLRTDPGLFSLQLWSEEGGRLGLSALLAAENRPTAVLAADEYLALGVMHQAMEEGLSIPGDLSVVSLCDRLPPETYPVQPTAIQFDYSAMAEAAMDMLLRADAPATSVVTPSLVVRDSAGAPAMSATGPCEEGRTTLDSE